jgi:hypothetical protein
MKAQGAKPPVVVELLQSVEGVKSLGNGDLVRVAGGDHWPHGHDGWNRWRGRLALLTCLDAMRLGGRQQRRPRGAALLPTHIPTSVAMF